MSLTNKTRWLAAGLTVLGACGDGDGISDPRSSPGRPIARRTRAALTLQQAYGVPVVPWGDREIEASNPINELLA